MTRGFAGVIAAVLTPVTAHWEPDVAKACAYYDNLLQGGCDGLNVLGTTGEGMSLSVEQRASLMRGMAKRGLPLGRMMVGTGSSSLADAIALTNIAVETGFGGVLMMPPFFYRGASDDGILHFFAAVATATRLGEKLLYLYNFPQMSGTTFTPELVRRIRDVVSVGGVKDSSNDLAYAAELHLAFPDLQIFPSSEAHLRFAKDAGLAGCISGTVALWSRNAREVWKQSDNGAAAQRALTSLREAVAVYPLIPAVRYLTAIQQADRTWEKPIPPLQTLDTKAMEALANVLG